MRSIEDIDKAFRDMGLNEATWGIPTLTSVGTEATTSTQVFIRIDTATTPLEKETDAHLAQPSQ
jgi:hypothetical protein